MIYLFFLLFLLFFWGPRGIGGGKVEDRDREEKREKTLDVVLFFHEVLVSLVSCGNNRVFSGCCWGGSGENRPPLLESPSSLSLSLSLSNQRLKVRR
jgi:hypothetical protein